MGKDLQYKIMQGKIKTEQKQKKSQEKKDLLVFKLLNMTFKKHDTNRQ